MDARRELEANMLDKFERLIARGKFVTREEFDVVREMAHHKYGCAVVAEGGKVVGVFTTIDAMRVLTDLLEGKPRS